MIVRIFLAWCVSLFANHAVLGRFIDLDNAYTGLAAGLLAASISLLVWVYGEWFLYLKENTYGLGGASWRIFERIFVPLAPVYVFTVPFDPGVLLDVYFIISLIICYILLGTGRIDLRAFVWSRRFHGFEKLSDSGVVSKRDFLDKKWLVLSLYFLMPTILWLIEPIYASIVD